MHLFNLSFSGNSRSLLVKDHDGEPVPEEDSDDPYGLSIKPGPPWEVPPKSPVIQVPQNAYIDIQQESEEEGNVEYSKIDISVEPLQSEQVDFTVEMSQQKTNLEQNDTDASHKTNNIKVPDAVD